MLHKKTTKPPSVESIDDISPTALHSFSERW
jgi:hypothetical protein